MSQTPKTHIVTERVPAALGAYSQGILDKGNLYTSGQIGLDPVRLTLVEGVEAQIRQVFQNIVSRA